MLKKIAKILSMGSLAGLLIAKIRGVRINPPALRILLAILVAMSLLVDTPIVVLIAGTWLIFLLTTDVARLMGINLSLFLPAQKAKPENNEEQKSLSFSSIGGKILSLFPSVNKTKSQNNEEQKPHFFRQ